MCLDLPALVVARDGDVATVEVDGRRRVASTFLVPDVAVGDWVYIAAGTILDRIEPAEAALIEKQIRIAREA